MQRLLPAPQVMWCWSPSAFRCLLYAVMLRRLMQEHAGTGGNNRRAVVTEPVYLHSFVYVYNVIKAGLTQACLGKHGKSSEAQCAMWEARSLHHALRYTVKPYSVNVTAQL